MSTVLYDGEGRVLAVNAAFETLWGVGLAQVPSGYSVLADPQLLAAGVIPTLRRAFGLDGATTGEGEPVQLPPIRYDVARETGLGRAVWTQAHAYPVRAADGSVSRVVLTHIDVSDRVAREDALRSAHEQLATARAVSDSQRERLLRVIAQVPAAMGVLLGRDHRYLAVSDAFRRMVPGREFEGRTNAEVFPELVEQGFGAILDRVLSTGEPFTGQNVPARYDADGDGVLEDHLVDFTYQPLRNMHGDVEGIVFDAAEVSERVRAEQALRDREARLRLALDVAELGTWEWDLATGDARLDARGAEIVGLTPEEAMNARQAQMDRVHREDYAGVMSAFEAGLASGAPFDLRYRVVKRDGTTHHVHSRALVERDAQGNPVRIVGTNRDATLERESESRLRVSEARQRFLLTLSDRLRGLSDAEFIQYEAARALGEHLGATRVGYAEIDGDFSIVTRNYTNGVRNIAGRYRVADYSPKLMPAMRRGETVVQNDIAAADLTDDERAAHALLEIGATVDLPLLRDGELRASLFMHYPHAHEWSEEELSLLQAVAERTWEAVDRARAEGEREEFLYASERARAEAEAANRGKSEFLAVMSHELRTPLNAIAGYTELLELGVHGAITESQRTTLARIQASQRHLLGLINEVLNYARIDAGAVRYDLSDVLVSEAFVAAASLTRPQADARRLSVRIEPLHGEPTVRADREKLQQILLNLIGNAIKFTEPGGTISMSCAPADRMVRLDVRDTGIGIPSSKIVNIFEPFVQVDQRLTRRQEGVGLGLAISRDLARGMGGDLTVSSTDGEGSTFSLLLPVAD